MLKGQGTRGHHMTRIATADAGIPECKEGQNCHHLLLIHAEEDGMDDGEGEYHVFKGSCAIIHSERRKGGRGACL